MTTNGREYTYKTKTRIYTVFVNKNYKNIYKWRKIWQIKLGGA